MAWTTHDTFHVSPGYQPLMRELGLDAEGVWGHPDIKVWRSVTERENATLDGVRGDGSKVRLHVKRYHATGEKVGPAEMEAKGIQLLQRVGIPTVPLVGWGKMRDGRSFIISEDLAGYEAADKRVARGAVGLDEIIGPIADVAAKLHSAGLHHRDLYLCHFFVDDKKDVRLIDAGRVKELPGWPWRRRWVVKDLAQTYYSLGEIQASAGQIQAFVHQYGEKRGLKSVSWLTRSVEAKARRIARHDARLREKQPARNVSIPQ